jgi:ectoine hydroxylase-related dioxygenase (phytanoyl-CoA dioxygenase family)
MNINLKDNIYPVSSEQISFFDKNGFIFLPDVLNPEETEYFKNVIDKAVNERTGKDKRTLSERTPYEREFLQCGHLWWDNELIKELTLSKRLGFIARNFLQAEHVRLWHDQALYKLPGGDATEPHQDVSYWPMVERNAGTLWIALEEVTEEMGAMNFIPGSHKTGIDSYEYTIEASINKSHDLLAESQKIINAEPVVYNLKPGDATFHHGLTIHYTRPNNTLKTRKGMTIIYFSDGVRYAGNSPARDHFCAAGSENMQPIATERTPIII